MIFNAPWVENKYFLVFVYLFSSVNVLIFVCLFSSVKHLSDQNIALPDSTDRKFFTKASILGQWKQVQGRAGGSFCGYGSLRYPGFPSANQSSSTLVSTKMLSAHHALCESDFGAKVVTTALRGNAQGKFRTFPGNSYFQKKKWHTVSNLTQKSCLNTSMA